MAIQPIASNAQNQSLTVALRNICREYPAGGTVLRELLQNADDAGATEVRFILDDRTHPTDNLIHPSLAQYQGPALLAFNNAEFTPKDFDSLSRLGDSLKINDGSTTGKFGRGFNSTYNWTDSPSIISGSRLLILDPHYEWSTGETQGGPVYDFVKDCEAIEMKNHMAAYTTVMDHFDQPFAGSIIRIPLRTPEQALKSDISKRTTTISEVTEVYKSFASEFGESGLLFMRNIERLELTSNTISIVIEMTHAESLRSHRSEVNNAVKCALRDPHFSFDRTFEANIKYKSGEITKETAFVLHHSIQCDASSQDLRDWANDQQLFPWVAVAAQFPIKSGESVAGSLFTVLPLPVATNQPVHIHGLFSLSPDRARLHQLGDKSTQDQSPARWNNLLLQDLVPEAWVNVLKHIAHVYPSEPAYERWPYSTDAGSLLSGALEKALNLIEEHSISLWPSDVGYVSSKIGYLYTGGRDEDLRTALREVGAPVVYVPQRLQNRAEEIFKKRFLRPHHLCDFMRRKAAKISSWSLQTKQKILEYVLSEPEFTDYGGLELFPFMDGIYRCVGSGARAAFVHRDDFEKALFSLDDSRNLDLEKLSDTTQLALRRICENPLSLSCINYRFVNSLKDYCRRHVFKAAAENQDTVILRDEAARFVVEVWKWIEMREIPVLDVDISSLWLLPLSNGHHRKIKPSKSSSLIYFAPGGEVGELMWELDSKSLRKPLPLLDTGKIGPKSLALLSDSPRAALDLFIENGSNVLTLVKWLHGTWPSVDDVSDEMRQQIAKLITSNLLHPLGLLDRRIFVGALRELRIFQKLSWILVSGKMKHDLTWTSLSCCGKTVGLLDGIKPIPEIDGVQFVVATPSSPAQQLLRTLELGDCLDSCEVIQDHIIPAWQSQNSSSWTPSSKEHIADFILSQFSGLSYTARDRLCNISMVPVTQLNRKTTSAFALASQLIDPSVLELQELCFDDEELIPKDSFYRKYKYALKVCGLKTALDEDVVEQRIRCYASQRYPLSEVQDRVYKLLRSSCQWKLPSDKQQNTGMRRLKWLPAIDQAGTMSLKAANECRGPRDQLLISSQLPIVRTYITHEWTARLGWDTILSGQALISQLKRGTQNEDSDIVNAVLTYISQNGLTEELTSQLTSLPFVLASNDTFVAPANVFRPLERSIGGYERLQPYVVDVKRSFWGNHRELLIKVKVRDQLQLSDLIQVQTILETKPILEESDVGVAIEILNLASKYPREALTDLKIIDKYGVFHPIDQIYFDDLDFLKPKETFNLTHPDISRKTIEKLGIESLRDKCLKGDLEIEDIDDDDEFYQRESEATRIADTLERYPVETTFREYLANADDAEGTSQISWLLDQRTHPSDKLITPELKSLQGPAFLVHNNGVFSEKDFDGFKNVGEGSKAQDKEKIGQFGRGSQTMYHWTDVPMILSGHHLLILDPQQRVLLKNPKKGKRKPGQKLLLSKLIGVCSDQLAPFEGLWGYEKGSDYFPGTIFRFPLRTTTTTSLLRTSKIILDGSEVFRLMSNYFEEARVSLLFLRQIKSIEFRVWGKSESEWSITRQPPVDEDVRSFSEYVICSFAKKGGLGAAKIAGKDKWWVAIEDPDSLPMADRLQESSRRVLKNVECGIAALISSKMNDSSTSISKAIQSRMFNTLPLPISSDLPVHINATFSLSGDRQSISIDEYGARSHGSEWNRGLLQDRLPTLYLKFLEDLGRQVRQEVFNYWPQGEPPKRSCAELLCASLWEELPRSGEKLFPKAQLPTNITQRRAAQLYTINQAVFDFLPKVTSDALAPLLISLGVNLVRHIPAAILKHLKALPDVKSVTPSLLRQLFKSNQGRTCLLKEMKVNPRIWENVFRQLIPADTELDDLDGCYILPLADRNLAPLRLVGTSTAQASSYYVASAQELELFDFASSCLIDSNTAEKLGSVYTCKKFAIEELRLVHAKKLLKMRPGSSADEWLSRFWQFWNKPSLEDPPGIDDIDVKIFRAKCHGVEQYLTPAHFDLLPAVVKPSMLDHQALCDRLPGLYQFHPKFMPKTLLDVETSFYREASFCRLIKALSLLASSSNTTLGKFVETNFDAQHLDTLRTLIIFRVSDPESIGKSKRLLALNTDLKTIPIWPCFHESPAQQLLPAENSFMVVNSRLLVPWMKERTRFLSPTVSTDSKAQDCLNRLGAKKLLTEEALLSHVFPLPAEMDENGREHLKRLIGTIPDILFSQRALQIMKQTKFALDGGSNFRSPSELYDHKDSLFASAFRHQHDTKFLHGSMQVHRAFWLKVGLRQRTDSSITAGDYIPCLQALNLRLSSDHSVRDANLVVDSENVLLPLTSQNSMTHSFGNSDWPTISRQKVFRSFSGFDAEPEYRRSTMAVMAANQRLLSLSEIIQHEHIAVCWSQTSFAIQKPSQEVLRHTTANGRPSTGMVLRHLLRMQGMVGELNRYQLPDFLADLERTYQYLQDHMSETVTSFNLENKPVWLNIDSLGSDATMYDLSSWHGIKDLVLSSSCDSGAMKAVRPGLMRYEKLLRALGCESLIYPTVTRPDLQQGPALGPSLRNMWKAEELFDITYSTEGRLIKAHRVVLAAMSEKCARQFKSGLYVENVITFEDPNDDAYLSYHTLSTMIKFAYEDDINWKEMEVAENDDANKKAAKLDLLLDLHKGADCWDMLTLASQVEDKILVAGRALINLDNVLYVRDRADEAQARRVKQMCTSFIEQNQAAVDRAHAGNSE